MTMKLQLILLLTVISFCSWGQDKVDNYSFFKLYVTNDKDEVLLVKWEGQWEIVGERYNESVTVRELRILSFVACILKNGKIKMDQQPLCSITKPNMLEVT